MKKTFTLLFLICMGMLSIQAETLLSEDFETTTSMPPAGWSVIDSELDTLHWVLVEGQLALSGTRSAYCDASSYSIEVPEKEEWLITPELTLGDNDYRMRFLWLGASVQSLEKHEYDFQVRVSNDDGATWNTIWSFLNEEQVYESGVNFPWAAWAKNESSIDLSDYKNQKIKIAFVHCLLIGGLGKGNCVKLDDIKVEDYTPIKTPVVGGDDAYTFQNVYIGAYKYSEPLYITNTGTGTLEITAINGLEGTDFSTNIDISDVQLKRGEEYAYNVIYTPTMEGARSTTMKIETNGGTLEVALSGTKIMLDEGYTFESFEGDVFPPAGWKADTGWSRYNAGISGSYAAYCSFSDANPALITPRLDLSTGTYRIEYEMLEQYEAYADDAVGPENELIVYLSTDGGNTWNRINESNLTLNEIVHENIDLGAPQSDNCYIKFEYNFPNPITSWEEVPEWSTIFIDDVILPPLYGTTLPPVAAENPQPEDGTTDVYPDGVTLSWNEVQFAEGYKLYFKKQEEEWGNVIEMGKERSYTLPLLDYLTTYTWKVVPYNSYGECAEVPVWSFTTQADHSISEFPYFEGFEGDVFPPLGWVAFGTNYTKWDYTDVNAFDGNKTAVASGNGNGETATLQMPTVMLPDDVTMQISFYWGNRMPVSLTKKADVDRAPARVDSDTLYFEIKGESGVWTTLAYVSTLGEEDSDPWQRERILLTDYVGQNVTMRWRYSVQNAMRSTNAALDNITIEEAPTGGKAVINVTSWNAGEVNYKKAVVSPAFTLLNDGEAAMTITEASFNSPNFSTDLTEGLVIEAREEVTFHIMFSAGETAAPVEDNLTLTFEGADGIELPVSGTALPSNIRYYSFDEDEFGSTQPVGFTTVDRDGYNTVSPVMINYPNIGTPFAYIVINQKPEPEGADWRNIYPRSGDQMLAAMSPDGYDSGRSADDWIISEKMPAREGAKFRFYAKSYSLDDYFEFAKLGVYVSTTDNNIASFVPTSFENVQLTGLADHYLFNEFEIDLSEYAGQEIYVALRHTVSEDGFVTFFDDFYFENFMFGESSDAPVFTTTAPTEAFVGENYVYEFAAYDPDGDAITFTTTGLPSWLTMTTTALGGTISGTPSETGEYLFRINASDGVNTTVQEIILVVKQSGLSSTTVGKLRVYPNPAADYLMVEGEEYDNVYIYSLTGALVLQHDGVGRIDVEALPAGTYIVKVSGSEQQAVARFVKR